MAMLSNGHMEATLYELNVKDSVYKKRMLNAAIIGIDPQIRKLNPWYLNGLIFH